MFFNTELLEKIEIGTILYKSRNTDELEFRETVLIYDDIIFTGSNYKSMHIDDWNGNFNVISGVHGSRLFIPNSFVNSPDREEFYILLEKNLHPRNNYRVKELEESGFETQDRFEFTDLLKCLLMEELQIRFRVNNNYTYKIIEDEKYIDKTVVLVEREDSFDLKNIRMIEDFDDQDKYLRSLYHLEAENLLKEFIFNLVEYLEYEDTFLKDMPASESRSPLVRKYNEYSKKNEEKKKDAQEEVNTTSENNTIQIIDKVKSKIISQDYVIKKLIPIIMANSRLVNYGDKDLLQTGKKNILLIGPTGVGKTAIITEVSKLLNIPMVKTASTNFSGVGYVDSSLTEVLYGLINKADKDIEKAQKGIIYFDEVDKLFNSSLKIRDGIVDELLSWISGTNIQLKTQGMTIDFDTSLLTFIFGGAFSNIFNSMNKRTIGFGDRNKEKIKRIDTTDLIKFGMKDEFAGRLEVILELNSLKDFKSLRDILVYSEISPLKNMAKYFKIFYNIDIEYGDDIIDAITKRALITNVGARGLNSQVSKINMKLLEAVEYGLIKENSTVKLSIDMLENDYTFDNGNSRQLKVN